MPVGWSFQVTGTNPTMNKVYFRAYYFAEVVITIVKERKQKDDAG